MARGWESKAIESQQADADPRGSDRTNDSPGAAGVSQAIRTLELALAQTQAELSAACRPAHRDMLHARLDALQRELAVHRRPSN